MSIETIEQHAAVIRNGEHDKIGPGKPITMSRALVVGEGVAQGDLMLIVADGVPDGYKRISRPKAIDKQLVQGNTHGAKHCLDSLAGVKMWRPENWNSESIDGPYLQFTQDRQVLHPTHGTVHIPAGMSVTCYYQREYDQEMKRERRTAD